MGEPLELVPCRTVPLEIPAQAEIVIEGEIVPYERQREGPFPEYHNYYGQIVDAPCVNVKAITHRVDAIYAFVSTDERVDTQHILGHGRRALPEYATPRDVFAVEQIPVNANGKIDRSMLEQHLEEILNGPR